jgi:hypothetical protein
LSLTASSGGSYKRPRKYLTLARRRGVAMPTIRSRRRTYFIGRLLVVPVRIGNGPSGASYPKIRAFPECMDRCRRGSYHCRQHTELIETLKCKRMFRRSDGRDGGEATRRRRAIRNPLRAARATRMCRPRAPRRRNSPTCRFPFRHFLEVGS